MAKPNPLGRHIARQRKAAGLGLREAAALAKINGAYLMRIESGAVVEPSFRTIVRISRAIGIPLDELAAKVKP